MMKATLQGAVLLGLLAVSLPSYAEVQNIKIGGDITVRAFHRENLDLRADGAATGVASVPLDDEDNFFMTTTGINIGADLTENVSAFVRLASERDWDADNGNTAAADFDLSQAYITLKELFYSPLTVRIGQQPIVWGRGFVLGSNLLGSIILGTSLQDRNASIAANEYTDFTAFDAIRATLDLSNVGGLNLPLTADYVYIKSDENSRGAHDDINIQGINFSTKVDTAASEFETYYLNKRDKSDADLDPENGNVNTWGVRGSAQPVEGSYLYSELAYQWGTLGADLEGVIDAGKTQSAWAANLGGEYTFAQATTTPKVGAEWRFYSGEYLPDVGAIIGWDPVAPGYFRTAIREFQTRSTLGTAFYAVDQTGVTSGQTNQHELALYGGLVPMEDLSLNTRLAWFLLDEEALQPQSSPREKFIGTEWDTQLLYNYTDDVQFGLLYALFLPGSVFRNGGSGGGNVTVTGDATAQQIVTTVSVKF